MHLTANFYPAAEPKNGYVGNATVTIGNAIRINGIGVYENREGSGHHIRLPGYGEGENSHGYVVPADPATHAKILGVVEKAMSAENHFGYVGGKDSPYLEVSGKAVEEPYADGRYSIAVKEKVGKDDYKDICYLYGITSNVVTYEKEAEAKSFVAVNMPHLYSYTNKDGETRHVSAFEGVTAQYEKDGQTHKKDYDLLIRNLVLSERKEKVLGQRPTLEETVQKAQMAAESGARASSQSPEHESVR